MTDGISKRSKNTWYSGFYFLRFSPGQRRRCGCPGADPRVVVFISEASGKHKTGPKPPKQDQIFKFFACGAEQEKKNGLAAGPNGAKKGAKMVDFREEHFWFWSLAAADPACPPRDAWLHLPQQMGSRCYPRTGETPFQLR